MDEKMKKLLTPINIGNVTVKNRFFVGPMGIDYNNGAYSEPTAENIEYFVERAKGGFGLITIESTVVYEQAKGGPRKPCLFSDSTVESFRQVASA